MPRGYRVTAKTGHHKVAFDAQLTLSANASKYADYFERCRRKRNVIDYTRSHVATETEAQEILEKATEFHGFVEAWIDSRLPPPGISIVVKASARIAACYRLGCPAIAKFFGRRCSRKRWLLAATGGGILMMGRGMLTLMDTASFLGRRRTVLLFCTQNEDWLTESRVSRLEVHGIALDCATPDDFLRTIRT